MPFIGRMGGQERGREGMRLTEMVDLQYISIKVDWEPRAKMAEWRGGDGAYISEEEGEKAQLGGGNASRRRSGVASAVRRR
jgi:hypothetical protein